MTREELDKIVRKSINTFDAYKTSDNFTNRVMQQVYLNHRSVSVANARLRPAQIMLLVFGTLLMWATIIVLFWNAIDATNMLNYVSQLVAPILSNVVVKYALVVILIHIVVVRILLFIPIIAGRKISIKL